MLKNKTFVFGSVTCAVLGFILMVQPTYLIVFVNAVVVYCATLYLAFQIRGERKFQKILILAFFSTIIFSAGLYKRFHIQFTDLKMIGLSLALAGIVGSGTLFRMFANPKKHQ